MTIVEIEFLNIRFYNYQNFFKLVSLISNVRFLIYEANDCNFLSLISRIPLFRNLLFQKDLTLYLPYGISQPVHQKSVPYMEFTQIWKS